MIDMNMIETIANFLFENSWLNQWRVKKEKEKDNTK